MSSAIRRLGLGLVVIAALLVTSLIWPDTANEAVGPGSASVDSPPANPTATSTTTTTPTTTSEPEYDGWVDPASSGGPWGDEVDGLLTFRGNPTRTYYGHGADKKAKRK